ncbi:Tfp pilus assembly pathway, component PilC [Bibersteinia trehalosi USDA-ARS-USMARC-190]|uniref:Tfp pilus assembly pathway, component PilC n=1 Tax=Bibersteinia trehalosi USDA-ARS-USMARC-190 TaxID=1263832 RepID=W0R624_BIBTR|nr:type II secretion system F family protein [Bibersteinia trehalosi]AHG86201.1 Tfp pilus assembly pathway, component PilC [Bibersteinia trehalosi USDA-ARS-USMARC-190]
MFNVYEFRWQARDRFGQKQSGKQLAESTQQLEQRLQQQGFSHIRIQRNFVLPQQPKSSEITQFLQQFALLTNATIPLKLSLTMLLENCQNSKIYLWLRAVIQQLENGFSLAQSFGNTGKFLTQQEIQLIKIGEQSGELNKILSNITQNRQRSEQLNKKLKKILFYPIMILFISISLSVLLLLFIVPKFAELYDAKNRELPLMTKILFYLSDFLQHHFIALLISIISLSLLLYFISKKTQILTRLRAQILSILPLFKQIHLQARLVFFCYNCGLMLQAHLRLDSVLDSFISAKSNDPILSPELSKTLARLKQGYRLSDCLPAHLFPNEVLQMIKVGEQSGKLAEMLLQVSEIYRQKLEYQIDLLSQMLEPLLMLVIGFIVGTILIGLYLPIFDMGAMIE